MVALQDRQVTWTGPVGMGRPTGGLGVSSLTLDPNLLI